MNVRRFVLLSVFVPFVLFSAVVVHAHGYTGFLTLSAREPWALQMLIDLSIALGLVVTWLVGDARRRGLVVWPWLILTVVLGSIGPLGYLLYRDFAPKRG